ncbi:hypothetical protein [Streptomyces sp. NPDC005012]|uniref:hypothetical protein n=1 Tax=Streptomyces sp. NPDC005012 TaxID=3154558 RepID=UPI0033A9E3DC
MSTNTARHEQLLGQLDRFLHESEQILAAWDAYSDEHTDTDGWPLHPDAYGRRAAQRDAETWQAFDQVRGGAEELLAKAEAELRRIPPALARSCWPWELGVLRTALEQIDNLQQQWQTTRETLPRNAVPGTDAYDDTIGERDEEAWHPLNEWREHGRALLDIHATLQHAPALRQALTRRHTATPPDSPPTQGPGPRPRA